MSGFPRSPGFRFIFDGLAVGEIAGFRVGRAFTTSCKLTAKLEAAERAIVRH
jgi:hypothetical protein